MQFKNLRAIREDRDIKQKEVAEILNVSQNTYSQYETGIISLTAKVNNTFSTRGAGFPTDPHTTICMN